MSARKTPVRFSARLDVLLLRQVRADNPFASKARRPWDAVAEAMVEVLTGDQVIDGRRCRERTQLLLDHHKKDDRAKLKRYNLDKIDMSCVTRS